MLSSARLLLVDDDRVLRMHLTALLTQFGHQVIEMADGHSAYAWLKDDGASLVDALLLDRRMPGLDGLSLVRLLKQEPKLSGLPIIMVTGADQPAEMQEGINAGVFYYLTKPINPAVLKAVVGAAVQDTHRRRNLLAQLDAQRSSICLLERAELHYRTLMEAEKVATLLAPCFPQPQRTLPGLSALLVNAVEHGLLGMGYAHKSRLLQEGRWQDEVREREARQDPETAPVHVLLEKVQGSAGDVCRVTITDPGEGFNWQDFLELSPDRASDAHGRGIAQARAISFTHLAYNAAGNQVVAEAQEEKELSW